MKKILFVLLFCAYFSNDLSAQQSSKEALEIIKKIANLYNKKVKIKEIPKILINNLM